MKTGPPTQIEEQECGAAPHSCLIEMAHEVASAGQVKQWLVLVLATARQPLNRRTTALLVSWLRHRTARHPSSAGSGCSTHASHLSANRRTWSDLTSSRAWLMSPRKLAAAFRTAMRRISQSRVFMLDAPALGAESRI